MKERLQIIVIIVILVLLGGGAAVYKHVKLGFPLVPNEREAVWTVEATINFEALGGPVSISVNAPDSNDTMAVIDRKSVTEGYSFEEKDGRLVWTRQEAKGSQKIFFRSTAYRLSEEGGDLAAMPRGGILLTFKGPQKSAADHLVKAVLAKGGGGAAVAQGVIYALTNPQDQEAALLLEDAENYGGKENLACGLMGLAGVQARPVTVLKLTEEKKKQKLKGFIEFRDGLVVYLLNPRTGVLENRNEFLTWQKNNESIIELVGAERGSLTFSTIYGAISAQSAALKHGEFTGNKLIDFSIYSLPISQQNTFKLLLLIPIGALVVVILRNLVGIQTSGTFMPILIAMVFLEVNLLAGLALFVIIVGIGLVLRSYLSSLNLLLVPRISAVLVFVIIIYVVISVVSIKMDIEVGLRVTFFPMIIISWTIERMSILWEEEGPRDVFIQGGGSLFSASLIFLAMKNTYIGHLAYSFPELLLVVLAVIILLGGYSGYRLTELRRFEPLVREE